MERVTPAKHLQTVPGKMWQLKLSIFLRIAVSVAILASDALHLERTFYSDSK